LRLLEVELKRDSGVWAADTPAAVTHAAANTVSRNLSEKCTVTAG
jgi:hypothetical protein